MRSSACARMRSRSVPGWPSEAAALHASAVSSGCRASRRPTSRRTSSRRGVFAKRPSLDCARLQVRGCLVQAPRRPVRDHSGTARPHRSGQEDLGVRLIRGTVHRTGQDLEVWAPGFGGVGVLTIQLLAHDRDLFLGPTACRRESAADCFASLACCLATTACQMAMPAASRPTRTPAHVPCSARNTFIGPLAVFCPARFCAPLVSGTQKGAPHRAVRRLGKSKPDSAASCVVPAPSKRLAN